MTLYPDEESHRTLAAARWGAAGLLIAAAHVGVGWWVLTHPISQAPPPDTVQGVTIDLEPVAVPQNAPELNQTTSSGAIAAAQEAAAPDATANAAPEAAAAAAPEATAAPPSQVAAAEPPPPDIAPTEPPPPEPPKPDVPTAVAPTPPEPPPPEPQAALPPAEPEPTPVQEAPPIALPEQITTSDAVLAPPPKPRPTPPKPDPRAMAREAARRQAVAERREQQRAARAEARAQAQVQAQARAERAREAGGRAPQNTAPSSASSGASVSSWRGEVVAHLNSFKPASPNGAAGTARVAFSVDRSGRVLSASLAGSSGDAALDAAAVSMVRRASPVPAPPPELGGRVNLAVPVYFH